METQGFPSMGEDDREYILEDSLSLFLYLLFQAEII
jgi:hypothetical protein